MACSHPAGTFRAAVTFPASGAKAACVQDGIKSGRGAITGTCKQPPVASSCNRPDPAETNAVRTLDHMGGASPIDRLPTFIDDAGFIRTQLPPFVRAARI